MNASMPTLTIISPDIVLSVSVASAPPPRRRARAARVARASSAPRPSSLARRIPARVAASIVAGALVFGLGLVEVARAFTTPQHDAGVRSALLLVACVVTALAFAKRHAARIPLGMAIALGLLAHGITLSLAGQAVGPLFAGLAPVLTGLAHATIAPRWTTNLEHALHAARAASRSRRATPA